MDGLVIGAGALAAGFHVLFFALESLFWNTPAVRKIFRQSEEGAKAASLLAFNQGFYNLFLAFGAIVGLVLRSTDRANEGSAVLIFACASMLGAAVVLIASSRRLWRGAVIQGVPPLLCIGAFWLGK